MKEGVDPHTMRPEPREKSAQEAPQCAHSSLPPPSVLAQIRVSVTESASVSLSLFASLSPCLSQATHLPTPKDSVGAAQPARARDPRPPPHPPPPLPAAAALSSAADDWALWILPRRALADRRVLSQPHSWHSPRALIVWTFKSRSAVNTEREAFLLRKERRKEGKVEESRGAGGEKME